jgi:hypothetical protein
MATVSKTFTYVIKHPGRKAETVTLAKGVDFLDEVYRVIESADGNPPGRSGSMGDQPYPEQFDKPHLHFIYDDEFGLKPMRSNRWGINGPIMVARVKGSEYCSLRADEIGAIIEDLEQEIRRKPTEMEQSLEDFENSF